MGEILMETGHLKVEFLMVEFLMDGYCSWPFPVEVIPMAECRTGGCHSSSLLPGVNRIERQTG